MNVDVFPTADDAALAAAKAIAIAAREAVAARGRFVLAVSGGRSPWVMLRALAGEKSRGRRCTSCRSTSASPRPAIRRVI